MHSLVKELVKRGEDIEMHSLVKELVERGIEVRIMQLRDGSMAYDLNPATKSGMYMATHEAGPVMVTGRYNEQDWVDSLEDLAHVFARRYRAGGPGFGNQRWLDLAVEYGALERKEKVIVEYE